jgi:hypothetical protein
MFMPNAYSSEAIEHLTALKADGLSSTVHLPLWSVEPSAPLTPVCKGAEQAVVQIIQARKKQAQAQPLAYGL